MEEAVVGIAANVIFGNVVAKAAQQSSAQIAYYLDLVYLIVVCARESSNDKKKPGIKTSPFCGASSGPE